MNFTIQLDHCGLAVTAIVHGTLTLATGLLLLALRFTGMRRGVIIVSALRMVHLTLGILSGVYGLAAYLTAP